MKVSLIALIFLAVASSHAQSSQPTEAPTRAESRRIREIIEVTHCLKVGEIDWLSDSAVLEKAKILQVGLRHDRTTYPGKDVIFAVVLETPAKGDVFELTRENRQGVRSYRIENNGSFTLGAKGVKWRGEILGGIWTHEYIERNVRKLLKRRSITISIRAALRPNPQATCSSYASETIPESKVSSLK